MKRKSVLEEFIEQEIKRSLEEFNALSTGNVVGYTAPLGTPTGPIHKGFWRKDYKKKGPKTGSPALDKDVKKNIKDGKMSGYNYHPQVSELMEALDLDEAKIDDLKKKYPDRAEYIDQFKDVPQKYIDWIARVGVKFASEREPDFVENLKKTILDYDDLVKKNKIEKKDINTFPNVLELEMEIEDAKKKTTGTDKRKQAKENATLLYKDDRYVVLQPLSMQASCYYGYGTKWCISAKESENYFDNYTSRGFKFVFIIDKQPKEPNFAKVAVAYQPEQPGYTEIYNAEDSRINTALVSGLYPDEVLSVIDKTIGANVFMKYKKSEIDRILKHGTERQILDTLISIGEESDDDDYESFIEHVVAPAIPVDKLYLIYRIVRFEPGNDQEVSSYRPNEKIEKIAVDKLKAANVSFEEIVKQIKRAEEIYHKINPTFYAEYGKELEFTPAQLEYMKNYVESNKPGGDDEDEILLALFFDILEGKKTNDIYKALGFEDPSSKTFLERIGASAFRLKDFVERWDEMGDVGRAEYLQGFGPQKPTVGNLRDMNKLYRGYMDGRISFDAGLKLSEPELSEMTYKYAGTTRSPYGATYLQSDDPKLSKHKKIVKQVNKNLNKKAYTLHNPPEMGISITNPKFKDKKLK